MKLFQSLFSLLFIFALVNWLIKRSENCMSVEITLRSSKKHTTYLSNKLPQMFFRNWTAHVVIAILLLISGIEENPGPQQLDDICKTCLLPASNHLIDCSICSRDYSVTDINLPLFCYHYIYQSKGKFTFICQLCCDSYKEMTIVNKYLNTEPDPEITQRQSPSSNQFNKVHETNSAYDEVTTLASTTVNLEPPTGPNDNGSDVTIHPVNGIIDNLLTHKITDKLKRPSIATIVPLTSLRLKPPNSRILLKWCKIFRDSTERRMASMRAIRPAPISKVGYYSKVNIPGVPAVLDQLPTPCGPYTSHQNPCLSQFKTAFFRSYPSAPLTNSNGCFVEISSRDRTQEVLCNIASR